ASGPEVTGERHECDETAVGADRDPAPDPGALAAAVVRLGPVAGHADPLGGASLPVVHEHVGGHVGVPGHQVGGVRAEGHEAAVGAERGTAAAVVALVPGAVHAHPLGGAGGGTGQGDRDGDGVVVGVGVARGILAADVEGAALAVAEAADWRGVLGAAR